MGMISNNDKDFEDFLDMVIAQCTKNLTELRLVSELQKKTIQQLKNAFPNQSFDNFDEMEIRQGLHSLITISLLDLCVILRMFKKSEVLWERIFLIRKGYLTIYETIKAYEIKNIKVRKLIIDSGANDEEFKNINQSIKEYKRIHNYYNISKIRNKVSGHIDQNFDLFFDTINAIEPSDAIEAIKGLITILTKIDHFLSALRDFLNEKIGEQNNKLKQEINRIKQDLANQLKKIKGNNNH